MNRFEAPGPVSASARNPARTVAPGAIGTGTGGGTLFRNTFWGVLAEAVALPVALAAVVALTRTLGPAGYGAFALAATLVTFAEMNITAFLGQATVRFVRTAEDRARVESTCLRAYLATGAAVAALLWLAAPALARLLDAPGLDAHLRLFSPGLVLMAAASAHEHVLVGRGRFRARAVLRATFWLARLTLLLPLLGAGLGIEGAIGASVGAWLVALGLGRWFVRPALLGRGSPAGPLLRFAAPLLLSGLALRTFARLDLVALKGFGASLADTGTYVGAQNLALVPNILLMAFVPLLVSETSAAHRAGDARGVRDAAHQALRLPLVLAPFAALGAGAAGPMLELAYGAEYARGAFALRALLVASLAVALISIASALLVAVGRPGATTRIAVPMLACACAGLAWVVPRYGIDGAALLTAAVATAGAGGALAMVRASTGAAPPGAAAAASALLSALGFALAARLAVEPAWLLISLAGLALGALAAMRACGLVRADDVRAARALLR